MKRTLICAVTLALCASCATFDNMCCNENSVPLADVPAAARNAAMKAVSGLVLTGAEMETEKGADVYELEGHVDGVKYEVQVTADGNVIDVDLEGNEK